MSRALDVLGISHLATYSPSTQFQIDSDNDCDKPPPCKRLFRAQDLVPMILKESQSPGASVRKFLCNFQ